MQTTKVLGCPRGIDVVRTFPFPAPLVKDDAVWLSNWDGTDTRPLGPGGTRR
jgi:hypothetical protein